MYYTVEGGPRGLSKNQGEGEEEEHVVRAAGALTCQERVVVLQAHVHGVTTMKKKRKGRGSEGKVPI